MSNRAERPLSITNWVRAMGMRSSRVFVNNLLSSTAASQVLGAPEFTAVCELGRRMEPMAVMVQRDLWASEELPIPDRFVLLR